MTQSVHEDRGTLALFFGGQGLQQVDRPREVLLNGGLGGGVVQLPDFGDRVHRVHQYKAGAVRLVSDCVSAPLETAAAAAY